jgi:transposase
MAAVLALIGQLYCIDADSAPRVAAIREWTLARRSLPGSSLRKALKYMLELWSGLTVFVSNPWVQLLPTLVEWHDLRVRVADAGRSYGEADIKTIVCAAQHNPNGRSRLIV